MPLRLVWCFSHGSVCHDVFSLLTCNWGYRLLRGRAQRESAIFIAWDQECILSTWLTTVDADLGHLAEVFSVGHVIYCKVTLASLGHTLLFGSKSLSTVDIQGVGGLKFNLLEGRLFTEIIWDSSNRYFLTL